MLKNSLYGLFFVLCSLPALCGIAELDIASDSFSLSDFETHNYVPTGIFGGRFGGHRIALKVQPSKYADGINPDDPKNPQGSIKQIAQSLGPHDGV